MKYLDPVRDELATLRAGNRVACARFEKAEATAIRLRAVNERLTRELALKQDTLEKRTEAHQRIIDDLTQLRATVAACPSCANSQDAP